MCDLNDAFGSDISNVNKNTNIDTFNQFGNSLSEYENYESSVVDYKTGDYVYSYDSITKHLHNVTIQCPTEDVVYNPTSFNNYRPDSFNESLNILLNRNNETLRKEFYDNRLKDLVYNPNDLISNQNQFTKKPENSQEIIEKVSKDLDYKLVCEYSKSILKKYEIVDTRIKPLEYYYDSSSDIFYFSFVKDEPYVHIIGWSNYREQYVTDMRILDDEFSKKIRDKLVKFSTEKQSDLVLQKLKQYFKV